ncbi:MAG: hypothetical protein R2880_04200 [Deinococcales bacterium]
MNALSKRITGIVLLLLATVFVWMASAQGIQISRFVKMTQGKSLTQDFPILLGIALAILALLLIFKPDQEDGLLAPVAGFLRCSLHFAQSQYYHYLCLSHHAF